MRSTYSIAAAFALAALAVPAISSPLKFVPRDALPVCNANPSDRTFLCADFEQLCPLLPTNVELGQGETAKDIGSFRSARAFVTRSASSKTNGNMQVLCTTIFTACCPAGIVTITKSQIPLEDLETGSLQIVAS
jgi:hypothetical protein